MKRILLALAVSLSVIPAFAQKKKKVAYPEGLYAEVGTSKGQIVMQLEFEKAPMTVANFVGLSEGTIDNAVLPPGKPYYNGSRWHRVVPGHVIQGGMPARSNAPSPGYEYPNEIVPGLSHGQIGMVGIANGGPHTNGSQWYITLGDRSYLDGDYTVFGQVIKGMEVLPMITDKDSITTLKIVRVGKAAEAFHPTTASFKAMVERQRQIVKSEEETRQANLEAFVHSTYQQVDPYMRQTVVLAGEGRLPRRGDTLSVRYKAKIWGGDSFVSTSDGGKPWFGETPTEFKYIVGTTFINPGFDAGVAQMRKGEKRVLIIPPAAAYGAGGYYPPERKGEKRFHVGPYKTIIYEVEVLEAAK